ncbi:MAG: sigma-54-dependent Fis family transcriptional regulator [Deltaproteobacteria bacterium]|nr:sigma-54-dependent Fis family transcriptional regulator [Deltaproteobacteria bacterium]
MRVLVADDEVNMRKVLRAMLQKDGFDVDTAEDGEAALGMIRERTPDLLITDLRMPRRDGLSLLDQVRKEFPQLLVILITAHGTVDSAVAALRRGAFDYILKPFDQHEIKLAVQKAAKTLELNTQNWNTTAETTLGDGRFGIIGSSQRMLDIYSIIEKVADTPSTVLITGESGTGKELIATALHENSSRKGGPYIKINCAAIPKTLMESELFGYERGAFTGAVTSKPGRFELADGGTLFLDEIAEIPGEMQVKLLRALQESEFERVGGIKTLRVNVRIITATNRELKKEIDAGHFREDLFFRLNVVPITLPALRERTDDIELLVRHFVAKYNKKLKKHVDSFSSDALEVLKAYAWPGNIRELENVVERTVLFAEVTTITPTELPPELRAADSKPILDKLPGVAAVAAPLAARVVTGEFSMKDIVKQATSEIERDLIVKALEETSGNVTQAAKMLKISRKGLQLKMKELGLRDAFESDKDTSDEDGEA